VAQTIHFPEADETPAYSKSGIPNVRPMYIKAFDGSTTSCWQFSPDELQQLVATGGVFWIATTIETHQPIMRVTLDKQRALQPMPKPLEGG
jgi:hypothetical protein